MQLNRVFNLQADKGKQCAATYFIPNQPVLLFAESS